MSTATETVLLCFEDAAAFEVLVFLFDREVHVCIDHVLKLVGPCHLAGLVDLIDDQADSASFLAEVSDLLEASDGGVGSDLTAFVHAIVEALKGVNDEDELIGCAGLHHLTCVIEDLVDVARVTCAEAVTEAETLGSHRCLIEAFLCGVEEDSCTLLGSGICEGEHEGCLTSARSTGEEGNG